MGRLCQNLLAGTLGVVLLASNAEAAIAKCASGSVTAPGFIMMIDGEVIGDFPTPAVEPGDAGPVFNLEELAPSLATDNVAKVEFTCSEYVDPSTNVVTLRTTISVLTRSGLPRLMESYLEALVERQEGYRAATGQYATHLNALLFYSSRLPLPINMRVTSTGWTATSFIAESPIRCHVAVGSIAPAREGLRSGVVECSEN